MWRSITDRIIKTTRNTFGESVTYKPKAGGSYQIKAIFDNEYQAIDPDTQAVVSSSIPVLGVRLRDLQAAPKRGDRVVINGVSYEIVDNKDDSWGHSQLVLQKI